MTRTTLNGHRNVTVTLLQDEGAHDGTAASPGSSPRFQSFATADFVAALATAAADLIPAAVRACGNGELQLVVPAEMMANINDGTWNLVAAKDGGGLLPTAKDASGKFVQQVRLERATTISPNTLKTEVIMGELRQIAFAAQVLVEIQKLDAAIRSLSEQVSDLWRGKIASAVRVYLTQLREPGVNGRDLTSHVIMYLEEGVELGTRDLQRWFEAQPQGRIFPYQSPDAAWAKHLDTGKSDVELIACAFHALVAIRRGEGQWMAANDALQRLAGLRSYVEYGQSTLTERAHYTPERNREWTERLPSLLNDNHRLTLSPSGPTLLVQFSLEAAQ